MKSLRHLTLLTLLFASLSCVQKESSVTSCNFYEEHFSTSGVATIPVGEKIAQRVQITRVVTIKRFIIQMDLLTSESVNFSVYRAAPMGALSPDNSTLLGKTTLTSSHVVNSGKIEFHVDGVKSSGSEYLYMIIEPVGGPIKVYAQKANIFDLHGELWFFNNIWTKNEAYDLSVAISGC